MKRATWLLVRALLFVSIAACSRSHQPTNVLVHYYPFARSPYAPLRLTSAESVPGTFQFSVDEDNQSIQNVVAILKSARRGRFDASDIRLVIRFHRGDYTAVDSKGGVVDGAKEGRLSKEQAREVDATLEAMPENPYSRVIDN